MSSGVVFKGYHRNILEMALRLFGKEAQEWMLIEEMGELMQAMSKRHRARDSDESMVRLTDELADVAIMLGQIIVMHNLEDPVEHMVYQKLDRLQEINRRHVEEATHDQRRSGGEGSSTPGNQLGKTEGSVPTGDGSETEGPKEEDSLHSGTVS